MSEDDADRAWDEDPKDEPAVTSGEGEVHRIDTVPPPASGDAYSADTVIRDVPREALEAIREKRKNSEKRRAADATTKEPVAEKKAIAAQPTEEPKKADSKSPPAAVEKIAVEKPAQKKAAAPAAHSAHAPAHTKAIEPPVTASELTIALAAAIALIVIGFYVIGSAF